MEKNADSDAELASHNTSIRNLEVQLGKISQVLNTHPKGAPPSDTVVKPKGGNNTRHAMVITIRNRKEEVNPSRENIVDILESVVQKAKGQMPRPPPPYPQRLAKKNGENQFKNFIHMMKSLSINVPLVEGLEQMPGYAKFMKDLEDPDTSTIPCTIGNAEFAKDICDLGPSTSLMRYSVFKTLGIGQPRPTSMRLQMVDRTMKKPLGVIDDMLVRADKFILPADFVILDCEVDYEVGSTLAVLQKRNKAIGWTLADIRGISHAFVMHNINLEEGAKPSIEHQRTLNEAIQEVVKKEIIKWLDVGVVYPFSIVRGLLWFNVTQRNGA
ncbi:uncharacterized protein [Nicotiana sylvestris]|uniref:uncharacterized protein n=1 Tax=Nicotiana sylvestris TaxID=4096 RepID=UPI00388CC759